MAQLALLEQLLCRGVACCRCNSRMHMDHTSPVHAGLLGGGAAGAGEAGGRAVGGH